MTIEIIRQFPISSFKLSGNYGRGSGYQLDIILAGSHYIPNIPEGWPKLSFNEEACGRHGLVPDLTLVKKTIEVRLSFAGYKQQRAAGEPDIVVLKDLFSKNAVFTEGDRADRGASLQEKFYGTWETEDPFHGSLSQMPCPFHTLPFDLKEDEFNACKVLGQSPQFTLELMVI